MENLTESIECGIAVGNERFGKVIYKYVRVKGN